MSGSVDLFALPDELDQFRDAVRRFAEKEVAPHAAEADEREDYPWASFEAYRDSGLVRSIYPVTDGGDGGGVLTAAVLVEELARVCAATALFALISRLAVSPVVRFGSDALRRRYVPGVAAGDVQASYCLSEPEAGSDVASLATRATMHGDHYLLTGRKAWVTNAGISDLYTVFATTDPDAGRRGISAFVVERDWPGVSIGKIERKMGLRGSPTGEIVLDDVEVPVANRIGDEGQAFGYAMAALEQSRPIVGAQAVGLAQGAMEGYADAVLERVGRRMLPSFDQIHEAMHRHRVERGEAERFIGKLLGLELDRAAYERGAAFCAGVVERAGPDGLNRLFEREEMVPTPSEVQAPGLWLARIDLSLDES